MYCRFCNRKRKVGHPSMVTRETIKEGIAYIRKNRKVRDVLLSGGDPLLLPDKELHRILTELRSISHVEIIRIGTRVPCTLPQRISPELASLLRGFHPLFINTHFNHPDEITDAAAVACARLADAGIPLGCQTVLLKGVNDDEKTILELMQKLLIVRVRPYYLFQADLAKGTSHFWTPLKKGLDILSGLQGHTTGLCVPHFAVDLPGGGGKVNLVPSAIVERKGKTFIRNYLGKEYEWDQEEVPNGL
jgi:lysine 2,3-aminomutase